MLSLPSVSVSDVTVTEGNTGTTSALFNVSLSGSSMQNVTVQYNTANNTATAPGDYAATTGMLSFMPGQTLKTVSVTIAGDTLRESDETFYVNLTGPMNATILDGQGVGTITNDDPEPTLSINDVTVTEGNSGTASASFTVSLSAASGQTVTVQYATADGTAAAPSDYTATSGTLSFAPGQTTKSVAISVQGDTLYEAGESFYVNLSSPTNATILDGQGVGTITNDDDAPTISINDVAVTEGNNGTVSASFTVSLSAVSGLTATVQYATADDTAAAPTDYTGASGTLSFAPGQTTQSVTISVQGDTLYEASESFYVNLSSPTNATILDGHGVGTITNDDDAPTISIDDVTVTEGDSGTTNASFTVSLSAANGQTVTVEYATADGTAAAPTDYTATSGTLSFAPGQTTQSVSVSINGDATYESDETLYINLSNPSNATIIDDQGVGTITNDDAPPTISINDATVTEGNSGSVIAVSTVTLSAPSGLAVSVDYTTSDGSATDAGDYAATSGSLSFAPGATSQTITLTVHGDTLYESDETFSIVLTNPVNSTIADGTGSVTIINDDPNNLPVVAEFGLAHDTGESNNDGITSDPTVMGLITSGGPVSGITVEFDRGDDGIVDGSARIDPLGRFSYTPEGLVNGPVTIRARASEWDADHSVYLYTDWQTVSFTLDSSEDFPPALGELMLFRDTLASDTDRITTDPRITGVVTNDGRLEGLYVELDLDGDGLTEGSSFAVSGGRFWYSPQRLDIGEVTIWGRVRESLYGQPDYVYSPWTSLTFTLVDDPDNVPPIVTELVLLHDTGSSASDGVTGDPRLRGSVSVDGGGVNLRVEFDHDGDNIADGEESVALDGGFQYTPSGLGNGAVTVRARVVEWNYERMTDVFGPWATVSFTLDDTENLAPALGELRLFRDTGESPTDGITAAPTLTGSVTNDGDATDLIAEFDLDGDGLADAWRRTDSDGWFNYRPDGLIDGPVTIQVRASEWVPGLPTRAGDWIPITFTLDSSANVPPLVAELRLFDDTGISHEDQLTRDPRLVGSVSDDRDVAGLVVEFDLDGDGGVEGSTTTDEQGNFRFAPVELADGPVTVWARAGEPDDVQSVPNYGGWVSLVFTLDATSSTMPPTVTDFKPFRDTGTWNDDGITTDPRVRGSVSNDGSVQRLRIEFDRDGDGFADGDTTTDPDGDFVYAPPDLASGSVAIRARAGERDADESLVFGSWLSLNFTLEESAPANLTPEIFKLKLANDTGSSSTDRVTSDPALTGVVTNDNQVSELTVEFDHDNDGDVDGSTMTDSAGYFSYVPADLAADSVTIRARAKEWDSEASEFIPGDWLSLTFTLQDPPAPPAPEASTLPVVAGLRLLNDTGTSATDRVTTDPALTGSVANVRTSGRLRVEFDYGQDGAADGSAEPDWRGSFEYLAEGLAAGDVTIRARAGIGDSDRDAYAFGDWSLLSFTLQGDPNNTPPAVASLGLVYDTGTSNTDAVTSDRMLRGSVTDNGRVEKLLVELDRDGDGDADGSLRTDVHGGFIYTPQGLSEGPITIRARAREWDPGQAVYVFGAWVALQFTLDHTEDAVPVLASLELMIDTGSSSSDGITSDPTLTGTVTDDGNPSGLRVEFDHDGDGTADGISITAEGHFWYVPAGLSAGTQTVAARAGQCDAAGSNCGYSGWTSLSFTLAFHSNTAPAVQTLALLYDTGSSASDAVTSDSRLVGSVTNDGAVYNLLVEFDQDGDDAADGSGFTGSDGRLRYEPRDLVPGPVTIRARVREWDPAQAAYVFGAWSALSFTIDPAANLAPALESLTLLHDTGTSANDGVTRDARIVGAVTNDGDRVNLTIEFDHNADGVADGSTLTDVAGSFVYTPAGLSDGPVTIQARAVELPLPSGGEGWGEGAGLPGDWTALIFTLDATADTPPTVTSLVLANDNGASSSDGDTSDPTVKGQATNDSGVLHLMIEFDHNGDDTSDGTAITDHEGKFTYLPQGLAPGAVTIRARAKARDFGQSEYVTGEWTALSFTLQTGAPASPPQDAAAQSAAAAHALAVTATVETYNSVVVGTSNATEFTLENASFAPLAQPHTGTSSGSVSPADSTAFRVKIAPSVPANSSHNQTAAVTRTGSTAGASYTLTATVTIDTGTNVTGDTSAGYFVGQVTVCTNYSYSETSSYSDASSSTSFTIVENGSYCFSFIGTANYTVSADGSVSVTGGYTITEDGDYDYTYQATTSYAVIEPGVTVTGTAFVDDSGELHFTYFENGTYSSDPTGAGFDSQYYLTASGLFDGSVTDSGGYSVSFPVMDHVGGFGMGSTSGSYLLAASDHYDFTLMSLGGVTVSTTASHESILISGGDTFDDFASATFLYTDGGGFSYPGGGGSFTLSTTSFATVDPFSFVHYTLTESTASVDATSSVETFYLADFNYGEGGSYSGVGGSGNYTTTATAHVDGVGNSSGTLLATESSFSLIGNFSTEANGNGSFRYTDVGGYTSGGTTASRSLDTGAQALSTSFVAGGFAITEDSLFVGGFFGSTADGQSYWDYSENGTTTGYGSSSTFAREHKDLSTFTSGVNGSFFVTELAAGITAN